MYIDKIREKENDMELFRNEIGTLYKKWFECSQKKINLNP